MVSPTDRKILRDDLPLSYIGIRYSIRFGTGHAFAIDKGKNPHLYYQSQIFFQILDPVTAAVRFEFRVFYMFKCDKRINDEGFYELIYSFILSAISEFDREIKRHKSTLIINKSYTPIPTLEDMKVPVRAAYVITDLDIPSSWN